MQYAVVLIFFFFFQAEDGIRDRDVTGVQTCALPILAALFDRLLRLGDGDLSNELDLRLAGLLSPKLDPLFVQPWRGARFPTNPHPRDRKSTRLNSSHITISYAVFCLKKKIEIYKSFRLLCLIIM